jgi:hypothetical protein
MTDTRFTFGLSDTLKSTIEEKAYENRVDQAHLVRETLKEAFKDDQDVPAHLRLALRREQAKEKNELRWQRIHFPSNVHDKFTRAFEQGDFDPEINPGAIDELTEMYLGEADFLFDEAAQEVFDEEPNGDRHEKARQFVKDLAKKAKEAESASEFERLDPEQIFENYTGVDLGRQREEVERDLSEHVEEAVDLITDDVGGRLSDNATEPEEVIEILSNRSDIPDGSAEQIVEQALDVIEGDASIEEIEETTEEQRSSTSTETTEETTEEEIEADGGIGHDPEEAEAMGTARRLVEQGLTSIRKISERLTSEYDLDPEEATQIAGDAVNRESSTSTTEAGRDLDHRAGDRAATDGGGDR